MEFYNLRTINSLSRRLKIPLLSVLFLLALGANHGVTQQTDEEKRLRELFLKSRQKMEIVASPTPSPKPTPSPASSPLRQPSPRLPRANAPKSAPSSPTARPSATQAEEESKPTPTPQARTLPGPNPSQHLRSKKRPPRQRPRKSDVVLFR